MKTSLPIFLALILISSCGVIKDTKKVVDVVSDKKTNAATSAPPLPSKGPYTPGSYFKLLKEVDSGKDTRFYEFKYKTDGTFLIMQRSFAGGNLSENYYHKTTGTFTEASGIITHTILTDTCNDMNSFVASVTGSSDDIIRVVAKGATTDFYSTISWKVPQNISQALANEFEDTGCSRFK